MAANQRELEEMKKSWEERMKEAQAESSVCVAHQHKYFFYTNPLSRTVKIMLKMFMFYFKRLKFTVNINFLLLKMSNVT